MPKTPPQRLPKTGNLQLFSLRLPRPLWAELGVFAKVKGRSMNDLLSEVIGNWWAEHSERASVAKLVKDSGEPRTVGTRKKS